MRTSSGDENTPCILLAGIFSFIASSAAFLSLALPPFSSLPCGYSPLAKVRSRVM